MVIHASLLARLALLLLATAEFSPLVWPAEAESLSRQRLAPSSAGGDEAVTERVGGSPEAMAVRKMMDDEGEMFFQHYWRFDQEADEWDTLQSESKGAELRTDGVKHKTSVVDTGINSSIVLPFQAPFALHRDTDASPSHSYWARGLLFNREFKCPNGTNDCTSIHRPNSCCPSGSGCQLVDDTGKGDVACCGSGQQCAGNLTDCGEGYQSCPGSTGGGCCVPGYACVGTVGCAHSSTTTVVVNPQVTASPSPSSSSTFTSNAAATTGTTPSTSQTTTTTVTSTTSTITTSSSSSAAASSSPPSSNAFIAPARPTSAAIVTTRFLSASSALTSLCPTGFYQCDAYYHSGCCRIGRDCGETSCPASGSTTVAQGDGVTVVAPTAAAGAAGTGGGKGCAQGWQTCGADVGGGCCPPGGFDCGVESCTKGPESKVTGTEGVSVAKSPGGSGGVGCWTVGGVTWIVLVVALVGQIWRHV